MLFLLEQWALEMAYASQQAIPMRRTQVELRRSITHSRLSGNRRLAKAGLDTGSRGFHLQFFGFYHRRIKARVFVGS